ncbi:flavodoxin [Rhodococcoides trifolii]|uniref:Flavodoxin n=1 Tax=Rhodococcoides trifolii TaxID=908250 RepID=A0A917D2D7_9NOCA|nr:NAD(P)H-dependent oxidoreductase [Rhodococcus trifolii]GGG07851.1 flavodoxin [Rhodococcus trifolii]
MTATLLVVHHTPSPPLADVLDAVLTGARDPSITGVDVVVRPALGASISDVLAADGFLFGTPANFGYMSGALKHFFDTVYYPCSGAVAGKPWGGWVYGNNDTAGATASIQRIARGWGLSQASEVLELQSVDRERCLELGGTLAATLM